MNGLPILSAGSTGDGDDRGSECRPGLQLTISLRYGVPALHRRQGRAPRGATRPVSLDLTSGIHGHAQLIAVITRGLAGTVSAARQVSDSAGCVAAPKQRWPHIQANPAAGSTDVADDVPLR